jgi:hypothetical protein
MIDMFAGRYYYAKIRIHEMGLLFHFQLRDEAITSASYTPALNTHLRACVEAGRNYLDTLLVLDGNERNTLPCEEWFRTIAVLVILYKLSVGPREVPDWDIAFCRSSVDLAQYLDRVAERLSWSTQLLEPWTRTNECLYFVLPAILRSVRKTFVLVRDAPHLVVPGDRVHMDVSKEQVKEEIARPKERRRCPAAAFWTDRALVLDQETDWCGVHFDGVLDPAAQLAKSEKLWSDLLDVNAAGDGL